jgi:hypothetical protein
MLPASGRDREALARLAESPKKARLVFLRGIAGIGATPPFEGLMVPRLRDRVIPCGKFFIVTPAETISRSSHSRS